MRGHRLRLPPSPSAARSASGTGRRETKDTMLTVRDARRFAAKEAAIKAHSHRRLTFHDVIIERRSGGAERLGSGPPVARIRAAASATAEEDVSAMISISHDGDYATAVCLAHDPSVVEDGQGRS